MRHGYHNFIWVLEAGMGQQQDTCAIPCGKAGIAAHVRRWLGNPTAALDEQSVRCWNDSQSITVVITDNCPCVQTDVKTGAVTGVNAPCCGDIWHMCGGSLYLSLSQNTAHRPTVAMVEPNASGNIFKRCAGCTMHAAPKCPTFVVRALWGQACPARKRCSLECCRQSVTQVRQATLHYLA